MMIYIILLAICVCFIILLSCITNELLAIVPYEIASRKLPEEFHNCKIVMLSDLHNHSFGNHNQRLYKKIEKINPDYIMLAGDMIVKSDGGKNSAALTLLEALSRKYPIYYSPGNHEKKLSNPHAKGSKEFSAFLSQIKKLGIHYLENETEILTRGKAKLYVSGLSIEEKYFEKFYHKPTMNSNYLNELLGQIKGNQYQILLAHSPNYFKEYAQWGADLVFSGHNHGGIVIFPFIGGAIGTDFRLFPKFDFGKFEDKTTTMILSKGLAMHTIKLRIFNRPEITAVTLKKITES